MTEIPLGHSSLVALIDDADAEMIQRFSWTAFRNHPNGRWYARRTMDKRKRASEHELLHRMIMDPPANRQVDHKNGNGLDCQRENMRLATHRQNQQNMIVSNSTGFKGVFKHPRSERWYARIYDSGKTFNLGCFRSPQEAGDAYARKARELFGEFACTALRPKTQANPPKYRSM